MPVKALRLGRLPRYWTIGKPEYINLCRALRKPLSGYIGGVPSQGYWVNELSDNWRATFGCGFAVPCNSGTSGLLAACMAAGIGAGDEVWVSTYTMSATATCAMILGANVKFIDIHPDYFTLQGSASSKWPKAIIVTNLFGCAAPLKALRETCDILNIILIEDNAQAPFATCDGKFTGTWGHMGVFSLNVHKHIQCGEGGVVVTDDPLLADRLEGAINHGELATGSNRNNDRIGLNLRMAEPIAAIACAQLKKGIALVKGRIDLADAITSLFRSVSFVDPPAKRVREVHAYYLWAGKINVPSARHVREAFVSRLQKRGAPFRIGYAPLLHQLFEHDYTLPVSEEIEHERLFTFEICGYDLNGHHLNRMGEIIEYEAAKIEKELKHDEAQEQNWQWRSGGAGGLHRSNGSPIR